MKKKSLKAILCFCIFPLGSFLFAQNKFRIGLDAGYTYTVMHSNLSSLKDSRYKGRYGYGINLSGEYRVWKTLFISTGVSYLQKNYEFERTGTYSGWYSKYTNNFLAFPLLVGTYVFNDPHETKGVWAKLAGGMYTEYWLSRKYDGQYPVFGELNLDGTNPYTKVSGTYDFKANENQFSRIGYGIQGQAQLGYSFNKFDVYGAFNYQYGLSDITKANSDKNQKMSTRSYMLSVGASYKFD